MKTEKCEAKTSKKAWANPLAPMARCENKATLVVKVDGVERRMCRTHANKAAEGRYVATVKACCKSLFHNCGCAAREAAR